MKKSEILTLIKQDIQDAAGDLDSQARLVLARCISVGMLPPIIWEKSFYVAENGEEIYAIYEWDPEDELKGLPNDTEDIKNKFPKKSLLKQYSKKDGSYYSKPSEVVAVLKKIFKKKSKI